MSNSLENMATVLISTFSSFPEITVYLGESDSAASREFARELECRISIRFQFSLVLFACGFSANIAGKIGKIGKCHGSVGS